MLAVGGSLLRELVSMELAIELMKEVFANYSAGKTISPIRVPIEPPGMNGVSLFMPAYVPESEHAPATSGAKIVSAYSGNAARHLPLINAVVVALDPETGLPTGIIDGGSLTALRTGAVSGAATDLLARTDASKVAIVGAGVQGVTQAAAVWEVREIEEIRVVDLTAEATQTFASRLAVWNPEAAECVGIADTVEDAVTGADIICTATTSSTPVFEDSWLTSGVHINGVGAFTPEMQEIPTETVLKSVIVVDAIDAVLHEAGDLIIPINNGLLSRDRISLELGHIVNGSATGRRSDTDVTYFKSVGNAIQDMIVAGAALQQAIQQQAGQQISLD